MELIAADTLNGTLPKNITFLLKTIKYLVYDFRNLKFNIVMTLEATKQLKMLKRIFETGIPPMPIFRYDHVGVEEGMLPYISCSDLMDYKYNIRVIPGDEFFGNDSDSFEKTENGKIIASYNSLEELVNDGWELD